MPYAGSGSDGGSDASLRAAEAQQHQQQHQRPRYPPFVSNVHGVLYKLRAEDMATIANKESGYVIKEVEVRRGQLPTRAQPPACASARSRGARSDLHERLCACPCRAAAAP